VFGVFRLKKVRNSGKIKIDSPEHHSGLNPGSLLRMVSESESGYFKSKELEYFILQIQ
jgi:hypothetical protein